MTGLLEYSRNQCLLRIIGTFSTLLGFLIGLVDSDEIHTTTLAPRCFFFVGAIALSCHLWVDINIQYNHEYHKYRHLYCFLYVISVITSSLGFIFTFLSMAVTGIKCVSMCLYLFSSVVMFTYIWNNMNIQYEAEVSRQRFRL